MTTGSAATVLGPSKSAGVVAFSDQQREVAAGHNDPAGSVRCSPGPGEHPVRGARWSAWSRCRLRSRSWRARCSGSSPDGWLGIDRDRCRDPGGGALGAVGARALMAGVQSVRRTHSAFWLVDKLEPLGLDVRDERAPQGRHHPSGGRPEALLRWLHRDLQPRAPARRARPPRASDRAGATPAARRTGGRGSLATRESGTSPASSRSPSQRIGASRSRSAPTMR